jgi:hypothetical protein
MIRNAVNLSKHLALKYGKSILSGPDNSVYGISIEDLSQDGLIAALKWGKDNPKYISLNIRWGVLRAIRKVRQRDTHIPHVNHGAGEDYDFVIKELPARELRTDVLVDYRDTITAVLQQSNLTEDEARGFCEATLWNSTSVPMTLQEFKEIKTKVQQAASQIEDPR